MTIRTSIGSIRKGTLPAQRANTIPSTKVPLGNQSKFVSAMAASWSSTTPKRPLRQEPTKTPFLPHVFRPNSFFTDFPPKANS